jgi:hypothetical protein
MTFTHLRTVRGSAGSGFQSPWTPTDVPRSQVFPCTRVMEQSKCRQCSESISLHISVRHDSPLFVTMHQALLSGFNAGRKVPCIPWSDLINDPSSWVFPECTPVGFEWRDPSKMLLGEIFRLLDHWKDREAHGLEPLIWAPSCPLLQIAEKPERHSRRSRHARALDMQDSDEEVFVLPSDTYSDEDGPLSGHQYSAQESPPAILSDEEESTDSDTNLNYNREPLSDRSADPHASPYASGCAFEQYSYALLMISSRWWGILQF